MNGFAFGSGTKILIVEDSPTQAVHLKYLLERHDFDVQAAVNGLDALRMLESSLPSVVISDIIMPEMDGYELCKTLRSQERFRSLPVLLLTSLSDPENVIKGLECGAESFIIKPYEEQALISRIQYILLNKEMRQGLATSAKGIEIVFAGKKHLITSSRIQILDLLLSTYESAFLKARELEKTVKELKKANETIKTLSGLIPICAMCKKVRDDDGYWQQIEKYLSDRTEATFSHYYCPDCGEKLLNEVKKKNP